MEVPKVYAAINSVMADLSKVGIQKNNVNQQQKFKFRGIDDIYNALSASLSANKLTILPRVLSREVTGRATKAGSVLFYVVLDVEYDLVSAVDGSKHTLRVVGEAMDSADKATNKAMSAAYKYLCLQAFCIPTEGDNDADATTHEVAANHAISDAEAQEIKASLQATESDVRRFCAALKITSIDEMPKSSLARARGMLAAKLKAIEAAKAEGASNAA